MTFTTSHHPYLLIGTPADLAELNLGPQAMPIMAPARAAAWLNDLQSGQPFPLLQIKGDSVVENAHALATFLWLWNNHKIEGLALREIVDGRAVYRATHSLPDNSPVFQVLQDCRDWLLKAPVVVWRIPA